MMMCEGVSRTMLVSTGDEHQTRCKRCVLKCTVELEALRERRPPWPSQIITLILPTVKKPWL